MIKTIWEEVDKSDIAKSVVILDLFTKTFCFHIDKLPRFRYNNITII